MELVPNPNCMPAILKVRFMACSAVSSPLRFTTFFKVSLSRLLTTPLPTKPPTPAPNANDPAASTVEGSASPKPPDKNLNTSDGSSHLTSDARLIDGLYSDALCCASAALSMRLDSASSNPKLPAANPSPPNAVLFIPSYPRPRPSGISFKPPMKPSRPGSGALTMSKY